LGRSDVGEGCLGRLVHFQRKKGPPMNVPLRKLAELVGGQVLGDADILIGAARSLQEAQRGDITFVEDNKHLPLLSHCRASAAVTSCSVKQAGISLIQVADPLAAFMAIVGYFQSGTAWSPAPAIGIDPRAAVHASVQLGADASVLPFACIGEGSRVGVRCRIYSGAVIGRGCRLGDDVTIYANVVLYDGTILGNRVIIHANAVIGADGFGYRLHDGRHVKVPQLGHVEIGDDVEIGACTTIDRGTFEATRIGDGTKIDNLVQIGHNCKIGRHNLLVSQMGIAGSSTTGDYVVVAGQVGITDHVHLGDGVIVGAKAGVTKDVAPGLRMLGAPATPEREQKRILMTLERLPEIRRDLRRIKQHLGLADEDEKAA
jgi:UDP-3-O-[3-hydroxymyristoyl] glucosamine N-acyltransferase